MDLHFDDLQLWFSHHVYVDEVKFSTIKALLTSYIKFFDIHSNIILFDFQKKLEAFLKKKEVSFRVTAKKRRGNKIKFIHGLRLKSQVETLPVSLHVSNSSYYDHEGHNEIKHEDEIKGSFVETGSHDISVRASEFNSLVESETALSPLSSVLSQNLHKSAHSYSPLGAQSVILSENDLVPNQMVSIFSNSTFEDFKSSFVETGSHDIPVKAPEFNSSVESEIALSPLSSVQSQNPHESVFSQCPLSAQSVTLSENDAAPNQMVLGLNVEEVISQTEEYICANMFDNIPNSPSSFSSLSAVDHQCMPNLSPEQSFYEDSDSDHSDSDHIESNMIPICEEIRVCDDDINPIDDVELFDRPKRKTIDFYFPRTKKIKVIEKHDYNEKYFKYRNKTNEEPGYYNNLIFSRHWENIRSMTPANMPCDFQSFDDFLDSFFPTNMENNTKLADIIYSARAYSNEPELRLNAFLCGSFPPVILGNVAFKTIDYLETGVFFPQFSVLSCQPSVIFCCQACNAYSPYAVLEGKSTSTGTHSFVGCRQLYEHSISSHHKSVLRFLGEHSLNNDSYFAKNTKSRITEHFKMEKKGQIVSCLFLWNPSIVKEFQNDQAIRRKQPKTIFHDEKLWKTCYMDIGHKSCTDFKQWKTRHPEAALELKKRVCVKSVFVEGKRLINVEGKDYEINGGIRSLEPMCLGTASSFGDHPYTCKNCHLQHSSLKNLIDKRKKSTLLTNESRMGRRGFRKDYATKTEHDEYIKDVLDQNEILRTENKRFGRMLHDKKSWERMILSSCENADIKKLVLDLTSLMQQEDKRGSIQMEVIKNLVGKLKSGVNHKYIEVIKDIATLHNNRLGDSAFSLMKDLFGLPGKTCAKAHGNEHKLFIGLNHEVFDKAADVYGSRPVVEASDEARTLRFISPVVDEKGRIELVGHSWDPDINKWKDSRVFLQDIISQEGFQDEFSALKKYVDEVKDANLAKDTAVHNFVSAFGVMSQPLIFLFWPTPNSGYCAPNLLKIWDEIRKRSFLNSNGSLREKPVMLIGHSTDSAGFQLASAVTLMTPQANIIKAGVKYLTLGAGESLFAAPYFGPLPSIAYLDYDHNLRLFLKCLKYTTLDMDIFPCASNSHVVTINHLKELKEICESSGVKCEFSNNDLLFARYLDQNSDAALKVFTDSVADLLMENVAGSSGTVLYIKGVVALFDPFLHPQCNPIKMQERMTVGITVFRIWRKILELKGKRINAVKGAATNSSKRGHFLTYGCSKTAEIQYSAATCHILAMFAHFSDLGPSAIGLKNCGSKTTERFISELQGKTNHLQSLDAQPTLSDIASKISKVQTNNFIEEKILARGGKKQTSTNRRRKAHQLQTAIVNSDYRYPESFAEFKVGQVKAFKNGVQNGIELFNKYCPEGVKYIRENGGFEFLSSFKNGVPSKSQFNGSLDVGYGEEKLNSLHPTDLLTTNAKKNEKDITDFMNPEEKATADLQFEDDLQKNELSGERSLPSESELSEDESNDNKEGLKERWYLTRMVKGQKSQIHLNRALKILINREYISRERSRRHIASKFVSRNSVDQNHNILCFRFVVAKLSKAIHVCKVASLNSSGKLVFSASNDNDSVTCRLIPLDKVPGEKHLYTLPEKILISNWIKVSNILGEIGMCQDEDGRFEVIERSREFLRKAKFNFSASEDKKVAQKLSKSLLPFDFKEVEDITDKKIDPETHQFLYFAKFKGQEEKVWLSESCFDRPIQYNHRSGLKSSTLFARGENTEQSTLKSSQKVKKRNIVDSNDVKSKRKPLPRKVIAPPVKKKEISTKTLSLLKSYAFPKLSEPASAISTTNSSMSTTLVSKSLVEAITISDDEFNRDIISGCDKQRNSDDDNNWCLQDDQKISEGGWLANKHLDKASKLLKKQFPDLKGLQKTIFGQSKKFEARFESMKGNRIQMHYDGDDHWVLSVSENRKLFLYDSLKTKPTESLQSQLMKCYNDECVEKGTLKVEYQNVCRQQGCHDCGLFVIAFATDIAYGNKPEALHYDQKKMRPHLLQCFKNGVMSPFPRSTNFCCGKMGSHFVQIEMK